jgi:tRNA A37 threonylcarbamoyltransferase TsaD
MQAARMLGITASPGGPALEQLALLGDPTSAYAAALPIPLQRKPGCDFS